MTTTANFPSSHGRIAEWHAFLMSIPERQQNDLVRGRYLPINSLTEYRPLLLDVLTDDEMTQLEDTYITFEKYDRTMATAVDSPAYGSDAFKRSILEYRDATRSARAKDLVEGIAPLADKLTSRGSVKRG